MFRFFNEALLAEVQMLILLHQLLNVFLKYVRITHFMLVIRHDLILFHFQLNIRCYDYVVVRNSL